MSRAIEHASMYRLMNWLSPSFPVGAFTYSHGLEYAVEAGLVADRDGLIDWVAALLRHGAGVTDAVLFNEAWAAAGQSEMAALSEVFEWGAALRPTAELALESTAQGEAFLRAARAAWPHPRLEAVAKLIRCEALVPTYPVIVAVAAQAHGVERHAALFAYLHGFAANLVSAAVRLIPLGQTDGQIALAALEEAVGACMEAAQTRALDNIGGAVPVAEWCSARHETQYTRLFRS